MGKTGGTTSKQVSRNDADRGVGKTLGALINSAGGRRFVVTVMSLVSAHVLAWWGKISGDAYGIVMVGVVAAFITGVTVQKVKGADGG
jgi:hypothetical protein